MRDWKSRESGYRIIVFLSSKEDYSVSTSFGGNEAEGERIARIHALAPIQFRVSLISNNQIELLAKSLSVLPLSFHLMTSIYTAECSLFIKVHIILLYYISSNTSTG